MSLRINKNHGFGNNTACNNCTKIIKAMQRLVQTCHDIFSAFLQHHPNRSAGMWNGADGPEHSGVSGYSTNQRVRMSPTAHQPPAACTVAARIKFKSLMLVHTWFAGSAPTYLNALLRAYVSPHPLHSLSKRYLALPPVHAWQSRLFSFVVAGGSTSNTSESISSPNLPNMSIILPSFYLSPAAISSVMVLERTM